MLQEKDRIFKNLVTKESTDLKSSMKRDDWSGTGEIVGSNTQDEIIEKVKASGICAKIAYEQQFKEDHQIEEKLLFRGKGRFSEDHNMTDEFDGRSQQSLRSEQEMSDTFLTSSVFDYTYFDTIVFT